MAKNGRFTRQASKTATAVDQQPSVEEIKETIVVKFPIAAGQHSASTDARPSKRLPEEKAKPRQGIRTARGSRAAAAAQVPPPADPEIRDTIVVRTKNEAATRQLAKAADARPRLSIRSAETRNSKQNGAPAVRLQERQPAAPSQEKRAWNAIPGEEENGGAAKKTRTNATGASDLRGTAAKALKRAPTEHQLPPMTKIMSDHREGVIDYAAGERGLPETGGFSPISRVDYHSLKIGPLPVPLPSPSPSLRLQDFRPHAQQQREQSVEQGRAESIKLPSFQELEESSRALTPPKRDRIDNTRLQEGTPALPNRSAASASAPLTSAPADAAGRRGIERPLRNDRGGGLER
ncbi:hypothetical protein [Rhizobium sp. NLR22b]|uniref:hypothetical protein n=1 Tax=Rhizobium sp. NLR22b TaxID=2731115 RepID=UPI001C82C0CC|nr:hypothetical protein [Rhizobium sp. NLR22b]MBX5242037.1 hypothetical protein [Rhizobium sp. NLR22b]